jgi:hypothetical protein
VSYEIQGYDTFSRPLAALDRKEEGTTK